MTLSADSVFESSGIRYLNISKFDGGNDIEREMLAPAVPAIYLWVHDFIPLIGRKESQVERALDKFEGQQGKRWALRADHFSQGEVRSYRPPLRENRRATLVREIALGSAAGRSIATLATLQQRPLYCGITTNLGRRTLQHLQRNTTFASSLTTIDLAECAVLWVEMPDVNSEDSSADESSDGDLELLENDDEHLAKRVPILSAFESLMLRVAMPMTNTSLDS